VSTKEQTENLNLPTQLRALRSTAAARRMRPSNAFTRKARAPRPRIAAILAFAERVLPRAADLWVQASLEHRQRYQQVFFPDGMSFDGNGCIGNGVTALIFSYLRTIEDRNKRMVDQTGASWNQFQGFIRGIHALRLACGSLADD